MRVVGMVNHPPNSEETKGRDQRERPKSQKKNTLVINNCMSAWDPLDPWTLSTVAVYIAFSLVTLLEKLH
jgi:hypothetical protein